VTPGPCPSYRVRSGTNTLQGQGQRPAFNPVRSIEFFVRSEKRCWCRLDAWSAAEKDQGCKIKPNSFVRNLAACVRGSALGR
jgi:hypothetical protein